MDPTLTICLLGGAGAFIVLLLVINWMQQRIVRSLTQRINRQEQMASCFEADKLLPGTYRVIGPVDVENDSGETLWVIMDTDGFCGVIRSANPPADRGLIQAITVIPPPPWSSRLRNVVVSPQFTLSSVPSKFSA
jgi:hypothetical protein